MVDQTAVRVRPGPLPGPKGAQEHPDEAVDRHLHSLDAMDLVPVRVAVAVLRHRLGELRALGGDELVEVEEVVGVVDLDGHGEAEVIDADVSQRVGRAHRPLEAVANPAHAVVCLSQTLDADADRDVRMSACSGSQVVGEVAVGGNLQSVGLGRLDVHDLKQIPADRRLAIGDSHAAEAIRKLPESSGANSSPTLVGTWHVLHVQQRGLQR